MKAIPAVGVVAVAHKIATIQVRQAKISRRLEIIDSEAERLSEEHRSLEVGRLGLLREFDQVA